MSADELYSTTMDPANRHLIQLTTDNIETTLELYGRLMGKSPLERRNFILKNKLSRFEEDEVFNDDEADE